LNGDFIVQSQIAMMNSSPIKMNSPVRRGPHNPEKIEANRAKKRVIQRRSKKKGNCEPK
jgi:hypothetical protein